MLGFSTHTVLFFLTCIGLLAHNPGKVSGLRSTDVVLRQSQEDRAEVQKDEISTLRNTGFYFIHAQEDQGMLRKNRRILEDVNMDRMKTEKKQGHKNNAHNPYQSSKRRVRRGSDPIHNKS